MSDYEKWAANPNHDDASTLLQNWLGDQLPPVSHQSDIFGFAVSVLFVFVFAAVIYRERDLIGRCLHRAIVSALVAVIRMSRYITAHARRIAADVKARLAQ